MHSSDTVQLNALFQTHIVAGAQHNRYVATWILHVGSDERVQHGAQQAGHAPVHDEGPLRVGHMQVVDQQQLCHKVSCPHQQPAEKAGDQSNQGHAAIRTFTIKTLAATSQKWAVLYYGAEPPLLPC